MIQTSLKIESDDLAISDLYKDFYTVPDFQREFVWERPQVEKLLLDVRDEFHDEEGKLVESAEYFLGSIVVCKSDDGTFNLIDGQQRMTTIYLVLCAIRDLLQELNETPMVTLKGQIASPFVDAHGNEKFRHRLVLQYDDSKGILRATVEEPEKLNSLAQSSSSVKRICFAYHDIMGFLRTEFGRSAGELRRFYAAFTQRVKLIRIITPSLANALKVFETINDRGVGLTAMDLLKNLLFMKTSQDEYSTLKQRWEDLIKILDSSGEKPLRFLRYFIMAHYELDSRKPLREDDIYDWFTRNTKKTRIDDEPLKFVKVLIECASAWSSFLSAKDVTGTINPYLNNLKLPSGAARQHFILLLAGRHLAPELFSQLCRAIENLFFCYIITRERTQIFERNFALWSADLRRVNEHKSLDRFIRQKFTSDLATRRPAFDFAFQQLTQDRIQQYRMRYVLARLTQYIEQQAWSNPAHANLDQYIAPTVNVEHILPQTPTDEVRKRFDRKEQYDDYVKMLGNLTLLEKTINTSVSNDLYEKKMLGYQQSSYLLTRSLVEKPRVGIDTQLNRAAKQLIAFDRWDSITIETRQAMLSRLAVLAWNIPEERVDSGVS